MRWVKVMILCTFCWSLNCGEEFSISDGPLQDRGLKDLPPEDLPPEDLPLPGELELAYGSVSTVGGAATTPAKLEGEPDFEIADDGLEYTGVHGDQCTINQAWCISEGGILP